jgi:hypothetical protein
MELSFRSAYKLWETMNIDVDAWHTKWVHDFYINESGTHMRDVLIEEFNNS